MNLRFGTMAGLGLFTFLAACGGTAANNVVSADNAAVAPADTTTNAAAPPIANTDDATKPADGNAVAGNVAEAAPDLSGARTLLDRIYRPYTQGTLGGQEAVESRALRAAMTRLGDLDADPYCGCQDFEHFSYRVSAVEPTAEGAVARVAIRNFGESKTIVLHLVQEGGAWKVADVGEGHDSLIYQSRHGVPDE